MLKLYSNHSKSVTSFHIKIPYHFNVCYVGETIGHFITRINDNLQKDPKSNIFKYFLKSWACNNVCNKDCFSVIDRATTKAN